MSSQHEKPATWIVLLVVGFIAFMCLVGSCLPENKPANTANDYITEKLANGEELNWLDKKVLEEQRRANQKP